MLKTLLSLPWSLVCLLLNARSLERALGENRALKGRLEALEGERDLWRSEYARVGQEKASVVEMALAERHRLKHGGLRSSDIQ